MFFYSEKTREGSKKLRELVVDRYWSRFLAASIVSVDSNITAHLDEEKIGAVRLSVRARGYAFLLRMPGKGRTTTLPAIVHANVTIGRSTLFCSHTNKAVDNLLRRLISTGSNEFLRLGRPLNVIDDFIQPLHMETWTKDADSFLEFE